MGSPTHESFTSLVTDVLVEGPLTGFEITRALEQHHQLALRGREGSIYAVLLDLERSGLVTSAEEQREDGTTRRCYRLPVLQDVREVEG